MIIKATNKFSGLLDLSPKERVQEDNFFEQEHISIHLRPGKQIEIDDKWYTLSSIQEALQLEYIEILDYDLQNTFVQEIKTPETNTPNLNLAQVEIWNRQEYPQEAFEKFNQNMSILDSSVANVASNIGLVKISSNGSAGFLYDKLEAGDNIELNLMNPGLNETIRISANVPSVIIKHNELTNLDYANAGHIGFEPSLTKGNLVSNSLILDISNNVNSIIGSDVQFNIVESNIQLKNLGDIGNTPLDTNGQILVWNNVASYFDFDYNINDYLTISNASSYALLDGSNQPFTGAIKVGDNIKHLFGTANDASIYYDGTNLVINPKEVGSGYVNITNAYNLPNIDGTTNYLVSTNGAGQWQYSNPTTISNISNISTKTNDYTLTDNDRTIIADGSINSVTIYLPLAPVTGIVYNIKCKDSTHLVTINGNGKTIDSSNTINLIKHETISVQYDGTEWWII